MTNIDYYLQSRYKHGGREYPLLDCWGLVRLAKFDLFGGELLPVLDVMPGDVRRIAKTVPHVVETASLRTLAVPIAGAIAVGREGTRDTHVGLCVEADGTLRILETDTGTGPTLTAITRFAQRFNKVTYYDY